jgi:drug/metabolite transporter (DMT)-like permease
MNKDQIIFKNLVLGSFLASLSAFLGGSTFVFTRLLVENIDPFTLSFLRYGLTGLILFLLSISYFFKNKFDKVDLIPMSRFALCNYATLHNCNSLFF